MPRRRRPGRGAPEIPRVPPPAPELPGDAGAPPGREVTAVPRPEPELPRGTPGERPESPADPNQPGA
jgi:hypothetical protein